MANKKKEPTLADIWAKLGKQDAKLAQIHEQTKKTNGRLLEVEKWKNDITVSEKAVAEYKQKYPQQSSSERVEGWSAREKTLTAIITALIAIIGALVGTGKL